MRFSEKLPKLRKENNLSQEQLADKLGVSRQAVSKWESGNSYPDMEKMLQMCKILNCHLENIMDDGVVGKTDSSKSKIDLNLCLKDFLNFITRSYNMFCSMKFREKIKCIFEMALIALILFIVCSITYKFVKYVIYGLIPISEIWRVVSIIVRAILAILSIIIFIHLFKIRYLDYFVTVEDQTVTEKTIEKPVDNVDKKEDEAYNAKAKEKIIIRDPKHSTLRFFEILGKIITIMIKILAVFIAVPVAIGFVLGVGAISACIFHINYGILFAFLAITFTGGTLLLYDIIATLEKFIFNREENWKQMFIIAIIGLVLLGVGGGLACCTYLNYEEVKELSEEECDTKVEHIEMQENLYIANWKNYEYEINDHVQDIIVEMKYPKGTFVEVNTFDGYQYKFCSIYSYLNGMKKYKIILQDIKNKQIRNYQNNALVRVKITVSSENYNKLEQNYKKWCE